MYHMNRCGLWYPHCFATPKKTSIQSPLRRGNVKICKKFDTYGNKRIEHVRFQSLFKQNAQSHCDIFRQRGTKLLTEQTATHIHKENVPGKKFLTATLSDDFKLTAVELNYEFEDPRNLNTKWNFLLFRTIKIPTKGTQLEIVPFKKTPKNPSASIQTLILIL